MEKIFLTWNMQGFSEKNEIKVLNMQNLLECNHYEALFLQECSKPLGRFVLDKQMSAKNPSISVYRCYISDRSNINNYYAFYYKWDINSRYSMIIYIKEKPIDWGIIYPFDKQINSLRPMLYIQTNNYVAGNVHLYSHDHTCAYLQYESYRTIFKEKFANLQTFITGDFNFDADSFKDVIGEDEYYITGTPTQNRGGCIDFVTTPNKNLRRITNLGFQDLSDHAPIEFSLDL